MKVTKLIIILYHRGWIGLSHCQKSVTC